MIGISLKAGTSKSREPLLNSYVNTQYKKIGKEDKLSDLEDALWDGVYSKLPGLPDDVKKDNYMSKKAAVRQAYLDYYLESENDADMLYAAMARISREKFVEQLNEVKIENIEPLASTVDQELIKREDKVSLMNKKKDILSNSPVDNENFYVVPKVIE